MSAPIITAHVPHFFTVAQAAALLDLKPDTVRFWSQEFGLEVKRSRTGHRVFSRANVVELRELRRLLYEERYTLKGAKQAWERAKVGT